MSKQDFDHVGGPDGSPIKEIGKGGWQAEGERYFLTVLAYNGHRAPVKKTIPVYPTQTERPTVIVVDGTESKIEATRHLRQRHCLSDLQVELPTGGGIEVLKVSVLDRETVSSLRIVGYDNLYNPTNLKLKFTDRGLISTCTIGGRTFDPYLYFRELTSTRLWPYYEDLAEQHPEFAKDLLTKATEALGAKKVGRPLFI